MKMTAGLVGAYALELNERPNSLTRYALRGFTLVELMVVLVILGLLASVVTISVRDYLVTGKRMTAESEIAHIREAVELYYIENDRYPSNEEGLELLRKKTANHPTGILQGDLLDPWGNPYVYIYPGVHGVFDILSLAADGQEGGDGADADVVSWNLEEGEPNGG